MGAYGDIPAGAGLGLRRALTGPLTEGKAPLDFLEVAPENWMGLGGRFGREFRALTERYPFICHGLSLSVGGPHPLDEAFVRDLRRFFDEYGIRYYSEHLSYSTDDGHLYDLLPIPFTAEAVDYVAARIRRVQELLGRRIAMENVSYYAAPGGELAEIEFFNAVVEAADCAILLDVNNVFVNSVNHGYDPYAYIDRIPGERIAYLHVAGHHQEAPDLLVDTHGADVRGDVWDLLAHAYARHGVLPTLLERDFNLPPLPVLLDEVSRIRALQQEASDERNAARA